MLERSAGGGAAPIPGIEIRDITPDDAPAYETDIGTDSATTVVQRLSAPGSSCWIARSGGTIVHASWVETVAAWMGEAGRYFVVPSGDAYIYESFTRPEMRGRGVYPAVLATISARMGAGGIAQLWIAAETTNEPSLRAIQKAGFKEAFRIEVARRLGRVEVRMPSGVSPRLREYRE